MTKETWRDVILKGPGPQNKKEAIILYVKGLIMGAADLVPGVSGGTVAFVTGIYDKLLEAIASVDKSFFTSLAKLNLKEAFSKIHLRFLIPLVLGIGTAIFSLARVMYFLMNHYPHQTWGLFFGLIVASTLIVGKNLESISSVKTLFFICFGSFIGHLLVSLIPVTTPNSLWFIFICGMIGITAMILPGLSGSFLLLILGKYAYVTGALKAPFVEGNFQILSVFLLGMITGLLSFTRILRFFLNSYKEWTLSFLTGLLIGSLQKIWPWKKVLEKTVVRGKEKVLREELFFPNEINGEVIIVFAIMIIGFVGVLLIESLAQKKKIVEVNP